MVDDKGLLKRDLAEDGLHPNPAGYKIMAPLAEAAIAKAMAANPNSSWRFACIYNDVEFPTASAYGIATVAAARREFAGESLP
jgi:hypothetical protein